jgi:hypothetical protein
MKVVINTCFGGFGLSKEAQLRLIGCPHIELMEPKEYYGAGADWENRFKEDQEREGAFSVLVHEGKVVVDNHRDDDARQCPALVRVVEEMGEAADSWAAALRIVEIPDGTDYEISEYDGSEHIAETHRTWR